MPTFKNTSNEVFQDGDLIVLPGEEVATEEESRANQFRVQYAWQFSESKTKNAPSEDEVKEDAPTKLVRELRTGGHVEVDDEGKQSKKVGS